MLAALAQATSRIRIGAMVNGMHHRHPAVTANMAATLDHISDGRFELGMGAGWNFMESDAYGMPLGELRDRSDRLEEGMEVIVSLLQNTTTTHKGRFFELTDAWCEPKPVQDRIPIVIGGKGRQRTLRTVARLADQWDVTFPETPAEWLKQHCCLVVARRSRYRPPRTSGHRSNPLTPEIEEGFLPQRSYSRQERRTLAAGWIRRWTTAT